MRTHVSSKEEYVKMEYINWFTTLVQLIQPKDLFAVLGRGSAKTSEVVAKRSLEIIYDMPRAKFVFVSDTYMNAMRNVVPTLLEGWQREGWKEGIHYVTDKRPPKHFKLPYKPVENFRHTIITFNGCMFTLGSLDQPSGLAGDSFQHRFGDEARLLKFDKLKKLNPAIRGEYAHFGHSVFYRGSTFTTDMPNPLDGDDEWIMQQEKNMDLEQIKLALQVGIVLNDIKKELVAATKFGSKKEIQNIKNKLALWTQRWIRVRKNSTFFYMASSFVNVDVLSDGFFTDSLKALGMEEFKSAILTFKIDVKKGERFYPQLTPNHFFSDGNLREYYERFSLTDEIEFSSLGLKYIDHHQPLECGVDFGNLISMVIGQRKGDYQYMLKEFYNEEGENEREIGLRFQKFFAHHKVKHLVMYYDRSGNQNAATKRDWAHAFKHAIETNEYGQLSGWTVELKSLGQGTIYQEQEYKLANKMFLGDDLRLPKIQIDQFNCKCLKSSLELAKVLVKIDRNGTRTVHKDKSSEKLKRHLLPMYSTNFSDAFKYFICRPDYLGTISQGMQFTSTDPGVY